MSLQHTHYMAMHYTARLIAPVLKVTGWRFSKAWRGNPVVNHVEANLMADGLEVKPMNIK